MSRLVLVVLVTAAVLLKVHGIEDDGFCEANGVDGGDEGCSGSKGETISKTEKKSKAAEQKKTTESAPVSPLAMANYNLLVKLYPVLMRSNGVGKSMVMSSFAVSSVLALAFTGARGSAREEMQKMIYFTDDQEVTATYQEVVHLLKSSGDFTGDVASAIFVSDRFPLQTSFVEQTRANFLSEPQSYDFSKSKEARQAINAWVKKRTGGKITNIVPAGTIGSQTGAVLANAVYFRGSWAAGFDRSHTRKEMFQFGGPRDVVEVDMMHITGYYKVSSSKELGCSILEMPFKGDHLSMLFLLPTREGSLEQMERNIYTHGLPDTSTAQKLHQYEVAIPRFKVETTHKLGAVLKAMGLPSMFKDDAAGFSGITSVKGLFMSEVVQKAVVEVSEEGSKSAAPADIVLEANSGSMMFTLNRPFLFAIQDNLTRMILFNGRVINPSKN